MIGAGFLLAAAGAATVAAVPSGTDTTGSNLALNGSDTLFDVTKDIINSCPTQFSNFATLGISYLGGGSGVGAGAMGLGAQQISPMSRALKSSEYCTGASGASTTFESGKAADLLVGIDGVAISANQTNSCSSTVANGFGSAAAFTVTADGTSTGGTPATCPGCDASGKYTFTNSFDALSVLYFGLTHDGNYSCSSPVRKSLIRNWNTLFTSDCGAGDSTCSAGLTHAWRRSDLSGTTDAFVSVINPPAGTATNGKGAGTAVGIGTLPGLTGPGTGGKSNPFCNSTDANSPAGTISFGGGSDQSDADPVRTACEDPNDTVCEAFANFGTSSKFAGDLGVVLPILIPDATTTLPADLYTTTPCGTACTLVAPLKGALLSTSFPNFKCPGGGSTIGGKCFLPFAGSATTPNPQCITASTTHCAGSQGKPDGRLFNLTVTVPVAQIPKTSRGTSTFQFALDANSNILSSAGFYRIHEASSSSYAAAPGSTMGYTGICQENDDTSQIGCLADSDPCSIGYAGRESAAIYPGTGSPIKGVSAPLKALAVNGVPPFTPGSDPDLALKNLLAAPGTTPLYPLSRRLYLATIFGFSNLLGGESELAACYGNNSLTASSIGNHGFVAIPGGVQCLDYPETLSTSTPAPNAQGPGNVALGGCGAGSNTNACTAFPPSITN